MVCDVLFFFLRLAKLFQQEFKVFIQRMKLRGRSTQYAPQIQHSSKVNEGNIDTLRLQTCSKSAEDLSGGRGGALMCWRCMFSVSVWSKATFFSTYAFQDQGGRISHVWHLSPKNGTTLLTEFSPAHLSSTLHLLIPLISAMREPKNPGAPQHCHLMVTQGNNIEKRAVTMATCPLSRNMSV